MMTFNRKKQGARLVIGGANDNRGAALGKLDKDRICPGHAMCVDDDCRYLIEGHTANCLTVLLNAQKATVAGKMATILADVYDLIQIAPET